MREMGLHGNPLAAPALPAPGRTDEYDAMVGRLKERIEYLASFSGLDEAIIKSIG
jgi:hypothetical protein